MIRVGPAGWQYKDWNGVVYPKPKPRGFDELSYIAEYFSTVEINTSFYGPPKETTIQKWLESVKDNTTFRFTAKLYQGFTHKRNSTGEEEKLFKNSMGLMMTDGKLGAVLMQFPWSFKAEAENREYLNTLIRKFREFPLVLEVRHASWITDDVLDMLAELGVGICNIDQPLFHRSVKLSALSTSRVGYVRLHGRNYRQWFSKTADVRERYDYLYPAKELEPWIDRIKMLERDAEDVYAVTNNHNIGKAVKNALDIDALLKGAPIKVPPTLMDRYTDLRKIAK